MNRNVTRGLAVAALTGGFVLLGATAANADIIGGGGLLGGGDQGGGLLGGSGLLGTGVGANGGLLGTGILGSGTPAPATPPAAPATPATPATPPATGGGLLGTGINLNVPVIVDGLDVGILDNGLGTGTSNNGGLLGGIVGSSGSPLGQGSVLQGGILGDGVTATTGNTLVDVFGSVGLQDAGGGLIDESILSTIVGVPVDLSGTWLSVLGNPENGGVNGIVAVPELLADPTVVTGGLLDSVITVPVEVTCTTVTVLSDFVGQDCAPGSTVPGGGIGNGGLDLDGILGDGVLDLDELLELDGLLGGELLDGGGLDLSDIELLEDLFDDGILNGDLLGDGLLGEGGLLGIDTDILDEGVINDDIIDLDDGLLINPFDDVSNTSVTTGLLDSVVGVPLDLTNTWISVLGSGANGGPNGIVIVPDLGTLPSVILGDDLVAALPLSLECVTITLLSTYERECGTDGIDGFPEEPVDPTDPTDPTTPVTPTTPTTPVTPTDPTGPTNPGTPANPGNPTDDGGAQLPDEGQQAGPLTPVPGDPCAAELTSAGAGSTSNGGIDFGLIGAAGLAGGLMSLAMLAFARRFGSL